MICNIPTPPQTAVQRRALRSPMAGGPDFACLLVVTELCGAGYGVTDNAVVGMSVGGLRHQGWRCRGPAARGSVVLPLGTVTRSRRFKPGSCDSRRRWSGG